MDVIQGMNEVERRGIPENVLSNRGLDLNAKKCLYEGVIVPTTLYGVWEVLRKEK